MRIFCTSFCNHGHILETGRPVDHECYVLKPKYLEMELWEGAEAVNNALRETGDRLHNGIPVRGRPLKTRTESQ